MKNIFTAETSNELIARINSLTNETQALWGKMHVAQMLAHCSVTYETIYTNIHPKPNRFIKFILKKFVKKYVVNEKPYKKSSQTAPYFIIADERDFEIEKQKLIDYIQQTQLIGETNFEGKESISFGPMTSTEWNNMLYKHLDHHLNQFGV